MYGIGLLKGLGVTIKHFFRREITEQYPEQRPDLPPASQGFFTYHQDKCIACGLCERACPNKVIKMDVVKDENNKKQITKYLMEIEYCLYCGLCIEACPTKALLNSNNFELSCYHRQHTAYDFVQPLAQEMNNRFDATQNSYWDKKRSGENPISMPEAVPAEAPVVQTPPTINVKEEA